MDLGTTMRKQQQQSTLAIIDLLGLHYSTTEFTAQGLSRTLAGVVEVTAQVGAELVLCECADGHDALWDAQVPLLSSSAVQDSGDDNTLQGGVPVRRIVQRWFDDNGS